MGQGWGWSSCSMVYLGPHFHLSSMAPFCGPKWVNESGNQKSDNFLT